MAAARDLLAIGLNEMVARGDQPTAALDEEMSIAVKPFFVGGMQGG